MFDKMSKKNSLAQDEAFAQKFLFYFYVPVAHKERVKQATFAAGAGTLGHYDQCCFETSGTGQFRPLQQSNPFVGNEGILETVSEVKVEMIVTASVLSKVLSAFKQAHPYEEPAFGVIALFSNY